jgi:hypothetical protein
VKKHLGGYRAQKLDALAERGKVRERHAKIGRFAGYDIIAAKGL